MSSLKPVTPAEAKAVWSTIRNPSARGVADALSQAGRPVHFATVARWRAQGWRHVQHGPHPVEAAREALDIAARVLTGDPKHGADFLERQAKAREELDGLTERELLSAVRVLTGDLRQGAAREELDGLTDRELLRRATRELCISSSLLSQELQRHLPTLFPERMAEVGVLLKALSGAVYAAAVAYGQVFGSQDQPRRRFDDSVTGTADDPMAELLKKLEGALTRQSS